MTQAIHDLKGSANRRESIASFKHFNKNLDKLSLQTPYLELLIPLKVRKTCEVAGRPFLKALCFTSTKLDDDSGRRLGFPM